MKMHKIDKMKYYPVVKKIHEICRNMTLESIVRRCLKLAEETPYVLPHMGVLGFRIPC